MFLRSRLNQANVLNSFGGRTRARTLDPLIKSHALFVILQGFRRKPSRLRRSTYQQLAVKSQIDGERHDARRPSFTQIHTTMQTTTIPLAVRAAIIAQRHRLTPAVARLILEILT